MDTSLKYTDKRLQTIVHAHIAQNSVETQDARTRQCKTNLRIQSILNWGSQFATCFGNGFRCIIRPCHSPLILLNFVRLYVEERMHLICQADRNVNGLAEGYDQYMVALAKIYYSEDREHFQENKSICLAFIAHLNIELEKLCLEEEGFGVPLEASSFIEELLSDLHRLDLSVSQVVQESLIGKSSKSKLSPDVNLNMQFTDFLQSCRELVKHSSNSLSWLISFFAQKIEQIPLNCAYPEPGRISFSYDNAQKGLSLLCDLVPITRQLQVQLAQPIVDLTQVSSTAKQMASACSEIGDYFYYNTEAPKNCGIDLVRHQNLYKHHPTQENKGKLENVQLHYAILDTYLTLHIALVTHFFAAQENFQSLLRSWQAMEKNKPGWTAQIFSKFAHPTAGVNPKQINSLLERERGIVLLEKCATNGSRLKRLTQAVLFCPESTSYCDKIQIGLKHSQLYVGHLAATFQSLLRNQASPEALLTIASSMVENSYQVWEQMGVARMGLLQYEPRTAHGLFPLYPKNLREQLGITSLIRDLSYANNWVRYPEQTFEELQNRSTLGEVALVPDVFRALLASSTKTTLSQTKMFAAHALEIAEKTLFALEPLIQILEGLVNESDVELNPSVQVYSTKLSSQIDIQPIKEIEKIWASALGVHTDVWKAFQSLPEVAALRHKERNFYLREIVGDIRRLQNEILLVEVTQISCHLSEKITLLFTSSLRSILEVRDKCNPYSYRTLKRLLQQCVISDALLQPVRPKPGSITYTSHQFVDLTMEHLRGANGLSRYPFKAGAAGNAWHDAVMAILRESNSDLVTSLVTAQGHEAPLERIIRVLETSANLFRYGILPVMQNIGRK